MFVNSYTVTLLTRPLFKIKSEVRVPKYMRHFLLQPFVCCLTFSFLYLCCFSLCSALSNNEADPYHQANHSRLKVGDVYESRVNEPLLDKRQGTDQQSYLSRFTSWVCSCLSGRNNSDSASVGSYTSQVDVNITTSDTYEEVVFLPQMPTYKPLTQADIAKHTEIAKDLPLHRHILMRFARQS